MRRCLAVRGAVVCWIGVAAGCGGGAGAPSPSSPGAVPAATVASTLGAAGGSVSLLGGAVRLAVPAGALATTVSIDARQPSGLPLDAWGVGGATYEITPAATSFATPAALTLRYQAGLRPSGTAVADLRIHRFEPASSSWVSLGGVNDVTASEATASISGAGTFSVRWVRPAEPCGLPSERQFDFWLGDWNLIETTPGGDLFHGTNRITRDESGCVIEEDYVSGGRGRSVSLYNRSDQMWHQTYIDSMGNRLVLIGTFVEGRMLLYSGATRSYWEPQGRDTVRFVQERSLDGGRTWTATFNSRYTRR